MNQFNEVDSDKNVDMNQFNEVDSDENVDMNLHRSQDADPNLSTYDDGSDPSNMEQDLWSDPDKIPNMIDDSEFENEEMESFNDFRETIWLCFLTRQIQIGRKFGNKEHLKFSDM